MFPLSRSGKTSTLAQPAAREPGALFHHVEGATHGGDPRGRAHGPERRPDRVTARVGRPAHHDVRAPEADHTGAESERMLEGGGGRGVAGEPLLVARTEQADA